MDIKRQGRRLKGFTLLELVVVIAIIAVLAAIAVPTTISQLRDSRLTAANDTAQQIYMAAQDYLTDLQIRGERAEIYFGKDSSKIGYIRLESNAGEAVGAADIKGTAVGANGPRSVIAANEIISRMAGDFQGAWVVSVYPETYTVRCAVYSGEESKNGSSVYNMDAVDHVYPDNLYTSVWGAGTSGTQEYDMTYVPERAYTGQYPVPVN